MTESPILLSGDDSPEFLKTKTTLCYIFNQNKVLLTMKKRGLGQGKWNAPGGKVKPEESLEKSVGREVLEETGLVVDNLRPLGFLDFAWPKDLDQNNSRCYIFSTNSFAGEIIETEECLPRWFLVNDLPYNQMWEDDLFWLPDVLAGKSVYWSFLFDKNGSIVKQEKIHG